MSKNEKLLNRLDIRNPYKDVYVVKPKLGGGDPFEHAAEVVDFPWREEFGAQVMVIDTITAWSNEFMNLSADDDTFAGKKGNIRFGGGKYDVAIPSRGDYRVGQRLSQEITTLAFEQDMHVIFCGHVGIEGKSRSDDGVFQILRAGAATVGAATVGTYGGQFDQYWRLKYKSKQDKSNLIVQRQGDQIFGAKLRIDTSKPLPDVPLPNTLDLQRKFWLEQLGECSVDLENPGLTGYTRAMIYGEIGTGKTRLALSFPMGPIVYIAVDASSEFLRSMYRELKQPVAA